MSFSNPEDIHSVPLAPDPDYEWEIEGLKAPFRNMMINVMEPTTIAGFQSLVNEADAPGQDYHFNEIIIKW